MSLKQHPISANTAAQSDYDALLPLQALVLHEKGSAIMSSIIHTQRPVRLSKESYWQTVHTLWLLLSSDHKWLHLGYKTTLLSSGSKTTGLGNIILWIKITTVSHKFMYHLHLLTKLRVMTCDSWPQREHKPPSSEGKPSVWPVQPPDRLRPGLFLLFIAYKAHILLH